MRHVLIPTDFSENATNAIKYALSFFKETPTTFYLLHVSMHTIIDEEVRFYTLSDSENGKKIFYNPDEALQLQSEQVMELSNPSKHRFSLLHEQTQFIESVRYHVTDKNIDFIVMGTKGASKFNNGTIGSHTGDVIIRVKCPVLIVPEKAIYNNPESILFPTDFHMFFKNKILHTLSDVLKLKKAKLNVLYFSTKAEELSPMQKRNRAFLQDHFEGTTQHCYCVIDENIEKAVAAFVANNRVDLIAMVAKNLNFFQRILFKPTIGDISYHTKIPFLVLHE